MEPENPCLRALRADFILPAAERGPVDFWALMRLAAVCLSVAMGGAFQFRGSMATRGKPAGGSGKWFGISERKWKKLVNGVWWFWAKGDWRGMAAAKTSCGGHISVTGVSRERPLKAAGNVPCFPQFSNWLSTGVPQSAATYFFRFSPSL